MSKIKNRECHSATFYQKILIIFWVFDFQKHFPFGHVGQKSYGENKNGEKDKKEKKKKRKKKKLIDSEFCEY